MSEELIIVILVPREMIMMIGFHPLIIKAD
jgi:hypothetical protein